MFFLFYESKNPEALLEQVAVLTVVSRMPEPPEA
jgi:hypothetical protein